MIAVLQAVALASASQGRFDPRAWMQQAIHSDACVIFGTSYGLHTILLKHKLIGAGAKCRAVDIDRLQRRKRAAVAVHLGEVHARIPSLFFNGRYYGGFDDLEGLFSHKRLQDVLWKKGATMIKCKEGVVMMPKARNEKKFGANQAREYLSATIHKHRCLLFTNTWCSSLNSHHARHGCAGASSWVENMLLASGAKCDIVDLFKDKNNNGIMRIESPPYRGKELDFNRARFGGKLPLASYLFLMEASPRDACSDLQGFYNHKVVIVRKSQNQDVCPVTQQLRMVQQAKGIGMIVVNDRDELEDLDGMHSPYLKAFAVSVSQSTGKLLVGGLASNMGFFNVYVEAGGHIEQEVQHIAAKHQEELPLLFLDAEDIGGEKRVAKLFQKGRLDKKLAHAGAFDEEPSAPRCHINQIQKLAAAEEKESSWFNWFGGKRRLRSV